MGNNFRKAKNILHLIILGLEIIFSFILGNYRCIECKDHLMYNHFVDATFGGFSVMLFILCVGICVSEELGRQTQLAVSYMGGIFHSLSGIFIGMAVMDDTSAWRMIVGLVFCLLLAGLFLFEAIYLTVKKEMEEEV